MSYLVPIAVIDSNNMSLTIYNIEKDWNNEQIEDFLILKGHKMSECNWGVFKWFRDYTNSNYHQII